MNFRITISKWSYDDANYYHLSASHLTSKKTKSTSKIAADVTVETILEKELVMSSCRISELLKNILDSYLLEPLTIELKRRIVNYENLEEDVLLNVEMREEPEAFLQKSCCLILWELNAGGTQNISTNGMSVGVREFSVRNQPKIWQLLFEERLTKDDLFNFFEFGVTN